MVNEFMGASFHNGEYEYQKRNAVLKNVWITDMNDLEKQRSNVNW